MLQFCCHISWFQRHIFFDSNSVPWASSGPGSLYQYAVNSLAWILPRLVWSGAHSFKHIQIVMKEECYEAHEHSKTCCCLHLCRKPLWDYQSAVVAELWRMSKGTWCFQCWIFNTYKYLANAFRDVTNNNYTRNYGEFREVVVSNRKLLPICGYHYLFPPLHSSHGKTWLALMLVTELNRKLLQVAKNCSTIMGVFMTLSELWELNHEFYI